jgi:hypothetical protein
MYPLSVTFVIVAAANHFVVDAVLGAPTAALGPCATARTAPREAAARANVPAEATA